MHCAEQSKQSMEKKELGIAPCAEWQDCPRGIAVMPRNHYAAAVLHRRNPHAMRPGLGPGCATFASAEFCLKFGARSCRVF